MMMGSGLMGAMGLWMVLWVLIGLAVLVLVVLGIIWLVRRTNSSGNGSPAQRASADEVLRRRYAAGEIDEQEYRRRRSGLS